MEAVKGMGWPAGMVEMSVWLGGGVSEVWMGGGKKVRTGDLDARGKVEDWGRDVFDEGKVFVAHGGEDVDAGCVEQLGIRWDKDADADRLSGLRGGHCEVVNCWVSEQRCYLGECFNKTNTTKLYISTRYVAIPFLQFLSPIHAGATDPTRIPRPSQARRRRPVQRPGCARIRR